MGYILMTRGPVLYAVMITLFFAAGCNPLKNDDASTGDLDETATARTDDGFVQIFDGKSLENWEGDTAYWSVSDGKLVGQITPETLLKTNSFIIWRGGETKDFELKTEFRITENGNSGINYRSE